MAEYVRDTFTRTLASGWGTGETGGAWTEALTNFTSSVVLGDRARWTNATTAAAQLDERLSLATPARDVMVATSFNTPAFWLTPATGWTGTLVTLWMRTSGAVAAPVGYYATCHVKPDGAISLILGRHDGTTATELARREYPAGTATTAITWRMEAQVVGSPTKLQARIYPTTPVPPGSSGWLITSDDVGPQVAGVYAIRVATNARGSGGGGHLGNFFDYFATDPPVPAFTYTASGLAASFNASTSTGDFTSYSWDWGDGTAAGAGINPGHTYAGPGTYLVKLTGTTRWGSTFLGQGYVTVAAPLPEPPELLPVVLVDGVNVCDDLYGLTWGMGGEWWTDGFRGQTCSLRLRGQYIVDRGAPVTIAVPAAVSGEPLWAGIIDQATEVIEPVAGRNDTLIVAMDAASWAARRHLRKSAILPEVRLPDRLDDLRTSDLAFRYGYGGYPVDGTRWPLLHKRPLVAANENLRERTYLDMVREALDGSIAYGFVARDGVIVYAPWEAPAGLPSTVYVDVDAGIDCASRVTLDRNALDGIVNRWSEGIEAFDFENVPSINEYGERSWSIPDDVLTIDGSLPHTTAMRAAMAEPIRAATVEVPVVDWAQKAITVEPLKLAMCRGTLMTVLGVRHEITVGDAWRVTLSLDRNPWAVDGRTPP